MKNLHFLSLLIYTVFITSSFAQKPVRDVKYGQKDFENNKVFNEIYNLRWHKTVWMANKKDTLSYFVDDRNYKGILNYGVEFKNRDFRAFTFLESFDMYFLKVQIMKTSFNPNDSIIDIEGVVSGGWGKYQKKGKPTNEIDVFLGEKRDTLNYCYLGNACYEPFVNTKYLQVKWNNKEIDNFTVLDTFPAFYFNKYSYYRTVSEGDRFFKVKGKINKNTFLAFGGRGCYSEIFDIGSMVFSPKKHKEVVKRIDGISKVIMVDNKLVSQLLKEKEQLSNKDSQYYTYTQNAENCIFKRQFAKAKEQYNLLDKKFNTIFARDIHNAIRCAILSRDYKCAFYFGKKLARKGIDKKYFNSKMFNVLRKNSEWNQFITVYDSVFTDNKRNINGYLKEQLEKLTEEDQADYGLENRKEPKVLFETTERVTSKLIDLLQKEGFPSEEKIGVCTKNDTILNSFPDFNVLIRHAYQQKPNNLSILSDILEKSYDALVYDKIRSPNHKGFLNSCFHIYKGRLYNNKSCVNNDLMMRKIQFGFSNPNNFMVDQGDFIVMENNKEHPDEMDKFYSEHFNFIMKLTDEWDFYEK